MNLNQSLNITENYTVECLGELELDVYDIEVEDTHSFFANNILVHNSAYIDLTAFANKVIPKDTPFDKQVEAIVKICDTFFADMLHKTFEQFAVDTNAWENAIDMKREAIASACFVAKKNYVMNVYDNEGTRYAKPKQKITGLEAVKSATPEYFRGKLKEGYSFVFDKSEAEVHAFVKAVHDEYMSMPVARIAGTISVNDLQKYQVGDTYASGTPGHVRGALAYNRLIKSNNLEDKYTPIRAGDKVKIVTLKKHNPLHENYFCYLDEYPREVLDPKYIDRDGNYDKYFVRPLLRVLEIVKWKHEYVSSLDEFF